MFDVFEEFIRERIYLKNVTPKTEQYHRQSYASYQRLVGKPFTKENLNAWVIKLRESGVKPVSCNTYISSVNAYLAWLFERGRWNT